ncbi:MBL fold metallo-hydrolase [Colwellia maritima]|uniref:MBL fold metallo-hydrolase n=1 Tax=Colwellia maritima TaxID=2912588 RepID=UPI0030842B1D
MTKLFIKCFFDEITNTATYVIADSAKKECAIIDSVLGFDLSSGVTSTELVDEVIDFVVAKHWTCRRILETHAHADHITAAPYLQKKLGGKIAIGKHIVEVQKIFKTIFNFESEFVTDGKQFDLLLEEGDVINLGSHAISILHTPGHTPKHVLLMWLMALHLLVIHYLCLIMVLLVVISLAVVLSNSIILSKKF